ncbi:MAG: NAD-dependent deacylase [Betaproteobacteria bacterium]|nr:NAD-dependent deacylase [Betaproteobacteria bacterium]
MRAARRVAVLTGAGISAESGVPTFRDAQTGLWARYRPEELATPEAYTRNPRMVWEWYEWRRSLVARARPNAGHYALAALEARVPQFMLITQNVDGLHHESGSRNVLELHGNIRRNKCFEHNHPVERWQDTGEVPPRCPQCGGRLRPDVVWFGEMLPEAELARALATVGRCDVFLSVGTSTVVEPAASMPFAALRFGAVVVEINPTETPLSRQAHHVLRGASGEVLPALVAAAWPAQ